MPPLRADAEMGWALANGERAKLSDYRGKVLVLDFYATWCAPCRASIPKLIACNSNWPCRLGTGGTERWRPRRSNQGRGLCSRTEHPLPLGFPDKPLTDLFLSDNQTIPQTFVFGRDGQLVRRFIGYEKSTDVELEKAISEALKQ